MKILEKISLLSIVCWALRLSNEFAYAQEEKKELKCITVDLNFNISINATSALEVYDGAIDYALNVAGVRGILDHPPSIQIREWLAVISVAYSVLSSSEADAIEFFGRAQQTAFYRRCRPVVGHPDFDIQTAAIERHALESFGYAYLWSIQKFIPEWSDAMDAYAATINLDLTNCPSSQTFDCGTNTPIGFARLIYEQNSFVFDSDGWNAEGDLTGTSNLIPYRDWRNVKFNDNDLYVDKCTDEWQPMNVQCKILLFQPDAFSLLATNDVCWSPISAQLNYRSYRQQWRHPHVGDTGRSYFLGDQEICDAQVRYPCYCFIRENKAVLEKLGVLDDSKKAETEFFNNVFLWMTTFQKDYYASSTANDFQVITAIAATASAMYEATLVVWKEKMRMGVIRPRTQINRNLKNQEFETYLGPETGEVGPIEGRDWVPFLPEEASGEFPSHTACLCYIFAEASKRIAPRTNGLLQSISTSYIFEAGSSRIETGMPSASTTLSYTSFDEISEKCAESRLNGGTNYPKSVEAAKELCVPISNKVVDIWMEKIVKGIIPDYVIDSTDLSSSETRDCVFPDPTVTDLVGDYSLNERLEGIQIWISDGLLSLFPESLQGLVEPVIDSLSEFLADSAGAFLVLFKAFR